MNKIVKLIFVSSVLTLSGCGGNNHFDYSDNQILGATQLEATVQMNDKLIIDISTPSSFFNSEIKEENILVYQKIFNKKDIKFNDVKDNRIKNFAFNLIDDKNISIILDNYTSSTYYVFFEKNASLDKVISYASVSTYIHEEKSCPIYDLEEDDYYAGEVSPSFNINYSYAKINDTTKISFLGAFKQLDEDNVEVNGSSINITTSGTVAHLNQGIIVLEQGFFEDVNKDVHIYSDVIDNTLFLDQTSFKLNGDLFTFNLTSIDDDFASVVKKDNVILGDDLDKITINDVNKIDDKKLSISLQIKDVTLNNLDSVLAYLDGKDISFKNAFRKINATFDVEFSVNYPSLKVSFIDDAENQSLKARLRIYNATSENLEISDCQIKNTNLVAPSVTNTNIEVVSDGFDINYETNLKFVYGEYDIAKEKIKTLWGEQYPLSSYFNNTKIAGGIEFGLKTLINTPTTYDENIKGVDLFTFLQRNGVDILLSGKYGAALASLEESLVLNDITHYSNNFLGGLMDRKQFMTNIVENTSFVLDAYNNIRDDALFKASFSKWNAFNEKYVNQMNGIINSYKSKFFIAMKELVNQNTISTKVTYVGRDDSDLTYASIMHPNQYYTSIEGFDVVDMYVVDMTTDDDYFKAIKNRFNEKNYYDHELDTQLETVINNKLNTCPAEILNDVKASIVLDTLKADVMLKIVDPNDMITFANLYKAYLNEISKDNSILMSYFNMLTSYTNYKDELENEYYNFLGSIKLDVVKFGSFLQLLNLFSLDNDNYVDMSTAIAKADNAIINNRYLDVDRYYSYVINDEMVSRYVKLDYENRYDANHNSVTELVMYDALTNTKMDDINQTALLSVDEINEIYFRYQFLNSVGKNNDSDFTSYLLSKKLLNQSSLDAYSQINSDFTLPIFTQLTGAFLDTSSTSFDVYLDASMENSSALFNKNNKYGYSLKGNKDCWSGKEMRGMILDIGNMQSSDEVINRYASYNDAFWNNDVDEHHLFKMNDNAMYCFVFYRY